MIVATAGAESHPTPLLYVGPALIAFSVVQILSYFYKEGYLEVISQALSLDCKVSFSLHLIPIGWVFPKHLICAIRRAPC